MFSAINNDLFSIFYFYFAYIPVTEYKTEHIQDFLNILRTGGKIGKEKIRKQTGTTILKQYCVLNEILEEHLKNRNPCRDVKAPAKNKPDVTILTQKQFKKVREYIRGTRDEIPVMLAASCGMRLSEIFGLQWENIDFENGLVKVRFALVKASKGEYVLKSPKSASGIRDIIASDEIMLLLKKHKKATSAIAGPVICSELPDLCSKRYETIIKKLDLPKTRFHDLRHYRATRMLAEGIPDILTSQQLGHSDVSMTKRYQHNTADIIQIATEKIKKLL